MNKEAVTARMEARGRALRAVLATKPDKDLGLLLLTVALSGDHNGDPVDRIVAEALAVVRSTGAVA